MAVQVEGDVLGADDKRRPAGGYIGHQLVSGTGLIQEVGPRAVLRDPACVDGTDRGHYNSDGHGGRQAGASVLIRRRYRYRIGASRRISMVRGRISKRACSTVTKIPVVREAGESVDRAGVDRGGDKRHWLIDIPV